MSFQMQIKRKVQWEGRMGSLKAFQRKLERHTQTKAAQKTINEGPAAMWTEIREIPPVTRKRFYRFQFEKQQRSK